MTTAAERAYLTIKSNILRGEYEAGQHIRESQVAKDTKLSRTPVREALRRLAAEQWITTVPNYGVKVNQWNKRDTEAAFSLHVLVESYAAERAAELITEQEIEALENIQAKYSALVEATKIDTDALQSENAKFHQVIVKAAGSPWLEMRAASLLVIPILLAAFKSYNRAELRRSSHQHDDLIDALKNRSSELAASVMKTHLLGGKVTFFRKRPPA